MTLSRDVPLIPENSALLFVDVQNFSANRQGAEFKDLPDAEFKEKYGWYFDMLNVTVIPNMQRIQRAARNAGVEVMYTTIESLTRDGPSIHPSIHRVWTPSYILSDFYFLACLSHIHLSERHGDRSS